MVTWTFLSSLVSTFKLGPVYSGAVQSMDMALGFIVPFLVGLSMDIIFCAGEFVCSCNHLPLVQIAAVWCSSCKKNVCHCRAYVEGDLALVSHAPLLCTTAGVERGAL